MKTKKIPLALLAALLAAQLFAQNAKYTELLNKAKKAEATNEYAYALGYYYDAIESNDFKQSAEAYKGLSNLESVIKSGKPGLGNYNEFSLHDEWKKLLINAEKYWTEYPPIGIVFNKFKKGDLDYNTKTATYGIKIGIYETEKAKYMKDVICSGLEKAYVSDWKDIPRTNNSEEWYNRWPLRSIFSEKDGTAKQIYEKHKVALYKFKYEYGYNRYVHESPFYLASFYTPKLDIFDKKIEDAYNFSYVLGIIRFLVFDKSGNSVFDSNRFFIKGCTFQGISPALISVFDSGEYEIRLTEYSFAYGEYDYGYDRDRTKSKEPPKNLSEIKFPLEKIEFEFDGKGKKKNAFVEAVLNSSMKKFCYDSSSRNGFEMLEFDMTEELYKLLSSASKYASDCVPYGNSAPHLFSFWDAIKFCNNFTKAYIGKEQCVYDVERELWWNKTKNGYRLPSDKELQIACVNDTYKGWQLSSNDKDHYSAYNNYFKGSDKTIRIVRNCILTDEEMVIAAEERRKQLEEQRKRELKAAEEKRQREVNAADIEIKKLIQSKDWSGLQVAFIKYENLSIKPEDYGLTEEGIEAKVYEIERQQALETYKKNFARWISEKNYETAKRVLLEANRQYGFKPSELGLTEKDLKKMKIKPGELK